MTDLPLYPFFRRTISNDEVAAIGIDLSRVSLRTRRACAFMLTPPLIPPLLYYDIGPFMFQVGSFLPCEAAYLQRPTADEADNENAFDGDDAEDGTLTKLAAALPADVSRLSAVDLDAPTPGGKWLKARIGIDSTPIKSEHENAVLFSLAPLCIVSKSVVKKKKDGQESYAKKTILDIDCHKLAKLWNARLLRRRNCQSHQVQLKTPKHIRAFADALLKNVDVTAALGSRAPVLIALRHHMKESDGTAPMAAARVKTAGTIAGGLSAEHTHTHTPTA